MRLAAVALLLLVPQEIGSNAARQAAGVTVLVDAGGDAGLCRGPGTIVRLEGEFAYVVCADSVLEAGSGGAELKIVAFPGSEKAVTVKAERVGSDRGTGLAIVKVKGTGLAKPLARSASKENVGFIAGFPEWLIKQREAAPVVAEFTKTAVARVTARLTTLEAKLRPGQVGGPVVDTAGDLMGVASITREGAAVALPLSVIDEFFDGRVDPLEVQQTGVSQEMADVTARIITADAFGKFTKFAVLSAPMPAERPSLGPDARGAWAKALPDMEETPATLEQRETAVAIVKLRIDGGKETTYILQGRVTTSDAKTIYSAPLEVVAKVVKPARIAEGAGSIAGRQYVINGATFTHLSLPATSSGIPPVFSADGRFLYLLEFQGKLHRIDLVELKETKVVDLGGAFKMLIRTREGLITLREEPREVVVIDEATLAIKRKLVVAIFTEALAGSPALSMAFCSGRSGDLEMLDLASGRTVATVAIDPTVEKLKISPDGIAANTWKPLACTPDGKYLLSGSQNSLHRFKIDTRKKTVLYEEAGPRFGSGDTLKFVLSPDSSRVAILNDAGVTPAKHAKFTGVGSYLYKIPDLAGAYGAAPSGGVLAFVAPNNTPVGFDAKTGELQTFLGSGKIDKKFALGSLVVGGMVASPEVGKAVALLADGIVWIEFPKPQ